MYKLYQSVNIKILIEMYIFIVSEGLGYYNRARNLKKAAGEIIGRYQGKLPADWKELQKLSGIGSYTAGAIASIAYEIPVPAVDGNVLRVVSRLLALTEDISSQKVKKQMENLLLTIIPKEAPGTYNQALMELGALVCIPKGKPHCKHCPFSKICQAKEKSLIDSIPYKALKKARRIEQKTVLLIEYQDEVVLNKRPSTGLLAGMYEFPNVSGYMSGSDVIQYMIERGERSFHAEPMESAVHIFSHVEWHMIGFHIKLYQKNSDKLSFVKKDELKEKYAVPSAFHVYKTNLIKNRG